MNVVFMSMAQTTGNHSYDLPSPGYKAMELVAYHNLGKGR